MTFICVAQLAVVFREAWVQIPSEPEIFSVFFSAIGKIAARLRRSMLFFIILAVFTKALCQLMEVMCGPLLQTLENRLQVNLKRTAALETEKEMLEKEINSVKAELQGSI